MFKFKRKTPLERKNIKQQRLIKHLDMLRGIQKKQQKRKQELIEKIDGKGELK